MLIHCPLVDLSIAILTPPTWLYCRYQKFEKEIGVGAYGVVYKARDLQAPAGSSHSLVAMKRIPLEEVDEGIPGRWSAWWAVYAFLVVCPMANIVSRIRP